MFRPSQWATGVLVIALLALPLGACGGDNEESASTPTPAAGTAKSSQIAAELPAAIKSKGTLTVAAEATYAPNEFIGEDGRTVEGMDADLAAALAGVLGLKARVVNATFDSIIPGLAANKYDLGVSSFTDTKEREKTVDFVDYFSAGISFYAKARPTPASTAGGPVRQDRSPRRRARSRRKKPKSRAKKCTKEGKKAVTVLSFPGQNAVNLAIVQRPRRGGHGRLAGRRLPGQAVRTASSSSSASRTGLRPTGSRSRRAAGMAKPVLGR